MTLSWRGRHCAAELSPQPHCIFFFVLVIELMTSHLPGQDLAYAPELNPGLLCFFVFVLFLVLGDLTQDPILARQALTPLS